MAANARSRREAKPRPILPLLDVAAAGLALLLLAGALPHAAVPPFLLAAGLYAAFPRARPAVLLLVPLGAGYLFWRLQASAGPVPWAQALVLAGRYLLAVLGFAASWAALERRRRWAVGPLAFAALVLAPNGATLGLGLLLAFVWNLRREREEARAYGFPVRLQGRSAAAATLAVALIALLLAGLGPLTLPDAAFPEGGQPPLLAPASPPGGVAVEGAGFSTAPPPFPRPRREPGWVQGAVGLTLLLFTLLLGTLLLGPGGPIRRARPDLRALLYLAGAVLWLAFVVLYAAFVWTGEGSASAAALPGSAAAPHALFHGAPAPAPPLRARRTPNLDALVALGFGFVLTALFGALAVLWRARRRAAAGVEAAPPPEGDAPQGAVFAGRVRRAYRLFLARMRPRLPRARSETPREYAQRLGERWPGLAPLAERLTRLYEPVRYGGRSDAAAADEAEALLAEIERRLHEEERG